MKRSTVGSVLLALVALAGCRQVYSLEIAVTVPEGVDVATYDFRTSIYAPGAEAAIGGSCQDFWWGEHHLDELAAALVGSRPSLDAAGIPDVPREGQKLVVVEGFGRSSQKRALFGCASLGDIGGEVVLPVALERTARLALSTPTGELAASVPFGGKALLRPPPDVYAYDDAGAPLAGVPVRVTLLGADGVAVAELGAEGDLVTDATGHLTLDMLEVGAFGAFQVSVRPRIVEGTPPAPLQGFAVPAQTAVFPFGAGADMVQVIPVPVGPRGIGFVGLEKTTPLTATLRFALPSAGPGLPTFAVVDPPGLVGASHRVFAVVHDPVTDEGVVLALSANGTLWAVRPDEARPLFPETTVIGETPSGEEVTLQHAAGWSGRKFFMLPLGPCSEHELAGPLVVVASIARDDGRNDVYPFVLDPLRDPPALAPLGGMLGDAFRLAFRSLCLADEGGELRRLLFFRNLRGGFTVANLGDEVPDFGAADPPPLEDFTVPGATAIGATGGERISLLVGSASGFSIQVNELRLVSEEDSVLGEPVYLYNLPAAPRVLGSGAFSAPNRREDYHLLSVGSGDEEDLTPGLLYFVTPTGAGGVELPSCRPAQACAVYPGDADDDGVEELYVGRLAPFPEDYDGDRVMAEVVRLTQP